MRIEGEVTFAVEAAIFADPRTGAPVPGIAVLLMGSGVPGGRLSFTLRAEEIEWFAGRMAAALGRAELMVSELPTDA